MDITAEEKAERIASAVEKTQAEKRRPFMLLRPDMIKDGNAWSCLYGKTNIQEGVCGFGDTPDAAARDFDNKWLTQKITNPAGAPTPS